MSDLDAALKAELLRIARSAIAADLAGDADVALPDWPGEVPARGVFITLRKRGALRGCIGCFTPHGSLFETVREMAVAAVHDARFAACPISAAELGELRIEVSVVSPLEQVSDPLDFEVGTHGIYVRQGMQGGCFLPQVATERGWSREEFLSQCCVHKAGLNADAWRDPETEVFTFAVETVEEPTSRVR